jgi:hypothetical protein
MDAEVAQLELVVDAIQLSLADIQLDIGEMKKESLTNFRIVFGALIAVSLGMTGLLAKGFQWI